MISKKIKRISNLTLDYQKMRVMDCDAYHGYIAEPNPVCFYCWHLFLQLNGFSKTMIIISGHWQKPLATILVN